MSHKLVQTERNPAPSFALVRGKALQEKDDEQA